jgi:hypothetical protein
MSKSVLFRQHNSVSTLFKVLTHDSDMIREYQNHLPLDFVCIVDGMTPQAVRASRYLSRRQTINVCMSPANTLALYNIISLYGHSMS